MTHWQSLLLGVIEGITEYLPISSTGHLVVAQKLMHIGTEQPGMSEMQIASAKEGADAFAVCIQGGAILAVLGLYWKHVKQMLAGLFGRDPSGLKLLIALIVGFMPAAVIGLLFHHWIEAHLFGLWPIVTAWTLGGIGILAATLWRRMHPVASNRKELGHLTWQMALVIGGLQCIAMCPGTSRSLMTIAGGLLVGLSIRAAVEYSFLLGVLTLTAATAKTAFDKAQESGPEYAHHFGTAKLMLHQFGATNLLVGSLAAAISAAIAVKWLVGNLQRHGLVGFGWYRVALGLAVGGMLWKGVIEDDRRLPDHAQASQASDGPEHGENAR